MRTATVTATVLGLCLLTTACGSDTEQRTASGGLFGLGLGALAGGPVGAAIGLGAGVVGGAVTPEGADTAAKQALGLEKRTVATATGIGAAPSAVSGSSEAPTGAPLQVSPDTVKHIQSGLQSQGLYNGPIDGIVGPKTRTALRDYQQRQGMTPTGAIDTTTLQRLGGNAAPTGTSGSSGGSQLMTTDQVTGQLQNHGYSNITDVRPYGSNAYTARANQGNTEYVVTVDGRSGQVTSRRPVSGGANQSSSGSTQPSDQGTAQPTGQSGTTSGQAPQPAPQQDQQQTQ